MHRYYSTQRPVAPGTFPKPTGNMVLNLWNFDKPIFCEQIGREAWGYVDYEKSLDAETARSYDLMPSNVKAFDVAVTAITYVTVEAADEEEAIEKACSIAWKYDAYDISGKIVRG